MSKRTESGDSDDFVANVKRQDEAKRLLRAARTGAQRPRRAKITGQASKYALAALSKACEAIESSPTRNVTTNTELFNLGQLVAAGELDRQTVEYEIRGAASRAGLPDNEIDLLLREDGGLAKGIASGPRDLSNVGIAAEADPVVVRLVPPPPAPPTVDFYDAEGDFWTSRKSLQDIYLAALSRMCAPWSVLACCAARALATVRPVITLPDIIGGVGSLNWFGAITASSGGGKGAAAATARLLVNQYVRQRNTGSGEGIIGAYKRPKEGDTPAGLYEALMFMVDEIDSLTAQTRRSGATTMSVLRSAFSGETLGFSYVNNNTPTIEAHTYRMTMIVSVQPARAADLLGDADGGTPQRFMWFPGIDKRISVDYAGGYVEPLTLPSPREWQYPTTVQIPSAARELILRERVKAMRGSPNALDGHALFVREKFAFALAVLDGRTFVTEEDWDLAGVAARVSDLTREWIGGKVIEAKDTEATERGRLQGVSSLAADAEKTSRMAQKSLAVEAKVLKYLRAAGAEGLTKRDVARKLAEDYQWAESMLNKLTQDGVLRQVEKRWYII